MCVDNSGSMRGSKIKNSINYLNQIAQSFNIPTTYFRFGIKVSKVNNYSPQTLPANERQTNIEPSLNDLFNNHLRGFSDAKTKFIFVTDAKARISNVANVISNKKKCEAAYGDKEHYLHSYCLLTGSGQCANELKQIFGDNAFDHCTNEKFKEILEKITGGVKTVNEVSKEQNNVSKDVEELAEDNTAEIREMENTINAILEEVKKGQAKQKEAQTKIDTVKVKLEELDTETTNVTNNVSRAYTHPAIERAEAEVNTLKRGYTAERRRLGAAGELLDETTEIVRTETSRADVISKKLEENGKKISKKAEEIITSIRASLKKLSEITNGSYEHVKELKNKFRNDLDDLMVIVREGNKLQTELMEIQQSISGTFRSLKAERIEYNTFKQEILNNMDKLNNYWMIWMRDTHDVWTELM